MSDPLLCDMCVSVSVSVCECALGGLQQSLSTVLAAEGNNKKAGLMIAAAQLLCLSVPSGSG